MPSRRLELGLRLLRDGHGQAALCRTKSELSKNQSFVNPVLLQKSIGAVTFDLGYSLSRNKIAICDTPKTYTCSTLLSCANIMEHLTFERDKK